MSAPYLLIPDVDGERKIPLDCGHAWKMGRNDDNEVAILNDLVSRYHAMLQYNGSGEYYLMDMGSRNGSFVNGSRVSIPVSLKDGDTISLGDYPLSFHWPESAGPKPTSAASLRGTVTRALYSAQKSSVLVVDVRSFTKLSQQIDQSLLCNLIGSWFREGGQLMQEKGSWAQKYIGDALMSVWVHRKADRESQEVWGILQACVEFAALTDTLQQRFSLPVPIRVGMGINSGEAMVGNTGSAGSNDYTALGDMVNAAFRFESATKEIGTDVIIGQQTFDYLDRCSNPRQYFDRRTVDLKGYDLPVVVWCTTFAKLKDFVKVPFIAYSGV